MLEICPTIAADRPSLEIHARGIGGKGEKVQLVLEALLAWATKIDFSDVCILATAIYEYVVSLQ